MLMYKNVEATWRPISEGKLFAYDVPSVYATGFGRVQLTVTWYRIKKQLKPQHPSLGSATNYKVIKELDGE
ncbi:hypothetical protein BGZ54_007154, partial [Gamsiella multidivaricata]